MAKYDAKTKPETVSVASFLATVEDEQVRDDCKALVKVFEKATGFKAVMWGSAIVGFGSYHYKYESGHEGDSCLAGFSPRKGKISLYANMHHADDPSLMEKLGKHKAGKGCIYIKKLSDIDTEVLSKIISSGVKAIQKKYPSA